MPIKLTYTSIDGCRKTRSFKRLAGAQKFAHDYVGAHPEQGLSYAVSADGIGKIEIVAGTTMAELFPPKAEPERPCGVTCEPGDCEGCFWRTH